MNTINVSYQGSVLISDMQQLVNSSDLKVWELAYSNFDPQAENQSIYLDVPFYNEGEKGDLALVFNEDLSSLEASSWTQINLKFEENGLLWDFTYHSVGKEKLRIIAYKA